MLAFTAALQTVFQSVFQFIIPTRLPLPQSCPALAIETFLFPSWLSQWSLVILICVSLILCVVWHFFVCSFTIYILSLLSRFCAYKQRKMFVCVLTAESSELIICIADKNPLSDLWFPFIFLLVSSLPVYSLNNAFGGKKQAFCKK